MKIKMFYIMCVWGLLSGICHAEGEEMRRSDTLAKFIFGAEVAVSEDRAPRPSVLFYPNEGSFLPSVARLKGLDSPEDVPFLIDVVKNGPDFSGTIQSEKDDPDFLGAGMFLPKDHSAHLARCYAVLCLAMIDDPRGHDVVYDIAKGGTKWVSSDLYSAEFKEINFNDYGPIPIGGAATEDQERRLELLKAEIKKQALQRYIVEEHNIRKYTIIGLGLIASQKSFDISMELLNDKIGPFAGAAFANLAEFGDMRAIEPMLEYSTDNSFWFDRGMKRLTQVNIKSKYDFDDSGNGFVVYPDYPEVTEMKMKMGSVSAKIVWNQWYDEVKNSSRKKLELAYEKYKNKEKPEPNQGLFYLVERYGVAALPFLMEKIEAGDEELIKSLPKLTRSKLKSDASKEEALLWWNKNKEKKTIKIKQDN